MPETAQRVIVDHPGCLHKGVANRRPDKREAALFQILAHRIGNRGFRRNFTKTFPRIYNRLAVNEAPDV